MASQALKIDPGKIEQRSATTEPLNESLRPAVSDNRDEKQIAALAYLLWQDRGCPVGSDQEDWFRAEREVARFTVEEKFVDENSAAEEAVSPRLRFPVRSEVNLKHRERLIR